MACATTWKIILQGYLIKNFLLCFLEFVQLPVVNIIRKMIDRFKNSWAVTTIQGTAKATKNQSSVSADPLLTKTGTILRLSYSGNRLTPNPSK